MPAVAAQTDMTARLPEPVPVPSVVASAPVTPDAVLAAQPDRADKSTPKPVDVPVSEDKLLSPSVAEKQVPCQNALLPAAEKSAVADGIKPADAVAPVVAKTALVTDPPKQLVTLPKPVEAPKNPVSGKPVSLALEMEKQKNGGASGIEKTGKTMVVAIFVTIIVLLCVAVGTWWFLLRGEAGKDSENGTAISAPVAGASMGAGESVPEAVQPGASEPAQDVASVPVAEPQVPASSGVVVPPKTESSSGSKAAASKATNARNTPIRSEEDEYLRQIRRQLDRQR